MRVAVAVVTAAAAWAVGLSALAATTPVDDVAFAPAMGAQLPLDAGFVDEHGYAVRLGDLLAARRAIVVPAYYGCSNLCTVVLEGLAASLESAQLETGRDVDVIVASISSLDTPAAALAKKRAVLGNAEAPGWHFLTGSGRAIGELTTALKYRFAYDEDERQYAHAAGIVLTDARGRVAQTLYGVTFAEDALRKGGVATVGSPARWLLCFRFDPQTGRYTFVALQLVRLVALATFIALAVFLVRVVARERRSVR